MSNLFKTFICITLAVIFICTGSTGGQKRTENVSPPYKRVVNDERIVATDCLTGSIKLCVATQQPAQQSVEMKEKKGTPIIRGTAVAITEDENIILMEEVEQEQEEPTEQTTDNTQQQEYNSDDIYEEPKINEETEYTEEAQEVLPEESQESQDEPTEESVEVQETIASYSDDDLYVLSRVICGEAMECSWDMQVAVGSVVLNRVNHYAFPGSISGVVFDPGQYACTWDGNYYRTPTNTNIEVAKFLLENGSQFPSYVIFQSDHVIGNSYYTTIGNMVFSYNSWDAY